MKKFVFSLILILPVFIVFAQKENNKVLLGYLTGNFTNPSYVNGNLKEMTQITYAAKLENGKIVKGDKLNETVDSNAHSTFYYNKNGELIKKVFYDMKGNPSWIAIINNEGKKIDKVFWLKKDTLLQYNKLKYENGYLKEISSYNTTDDTVRFKMVYINDKNGFKVKQENYNTSGLKTYETVWERDNNGRMKTFTSKNAKGEIISSGKYEYKELWDPVITTTIISQGNEINEAIRRDFEFDKNGNWIRQIRYKNNELFNITERTYVFFDK